MDADKIKQDQEAIDWFMSLPKERMNQIRKEIREEVTKVKGITPEGVERIVTHVVRPNKLLIVKNRHISEHLQGLVGPEWLVIPVLMPLVGCHFDLIILAMDYMDDLVLKDEMKVEEWVNQMLASRLKDKGVVLGRYEEPRGMYNY